MISGSIAILADSLHDFADSISLGAGWYFEEKSKKGSNDKYTYGYARFELLGAVINAVTLLLGSVYIIYASVDRIINPQMPDVYWMFGISILGIALNGLGAWKLKSGTSINKEVMMIHLLAITNCNFIEITILVRSVLLKSIQIINQTAYVKTKIIMEKKVVE